MSDEKHVNWPPASSSAVKRPPINTNAAVGPALRSISCQCCNTVLRVPANNTFRCSVCLTVTDVGRHPKINEHAPPLASEEVSSWKESLQAGELVDIHQRIRTVFVRPELLAASFLSRSHQPESSSNTVSLRALEVFGKLVKGEPERQKALNESVLSYLKRPYLRSGGLSTWRIFAILLACPFSPAESEVLSRLFGLLSNLPNAFHHQLVGLWRSESFPLHAMTALVDQVNSFMSARVRHVGSMTDLASDWKFVSASKVLALIFTANGHRLNGRLLTHAFYNLALDSLGPNAFLHEFLRWEKQNSEPVTPDGIVPFSICQYPFCISLGAKLHILESDSRRQMELEAKSAVFSTLFKGTPTLPVIQLRIRRSHLVHDSLREISAHIGQLKKSLRIKFEGEDGIDSGGLRKEWLMLLTNQLFHPDFAMFESDEDSKLCWPSGASALLDLKKEFFLVGITIGLSVYHQATIELPLPLACYKRLINAPVSFADLVMLKPALAKGLQQLLEYKDDDLEEVFCRTFVGEMDQFGEIVEVELVPGGKNIPVTKSNRHDFVSRLTQWILVDSVTLQFKALRRGFFEIVSGNALSLFQAEELELMVRGSLEPLDVQQMQLSTRYENGFERDHATIKLFWDYFRRLEPARQRKLLAFITGSDRVPATGVHSLQLRFTLDEGDISRFPSSHTCFSQLVFPAYTSPDQLKQAFDTAMDGSVGFGLR